MPIEFTCQNCNTTLRVPDEHAGKQARCPQCQSLNLVQPDSARSTSVPQSDSAGNFSPPFNPNPGKPIGPASSNPYAAGASPVGKSQAYHSPHRGSMILTFGILSLLCNFMLIPGILAWVMGSGDLKQMKAGRMDPEGHGLTMAGMILGIISTALVGLIFMFYAVVLVFVMIGAAAQ